MSEDYITTSINATNLPTSSSATSSLVLLTKTTLNPPISTTPRTLVCGLDLEKAELPVILLTTLLVNIVSFIVLLRMRGTCDSVDHLLVSLLNLNDLLTTVIFTVSWVAGLASCGDLLLTDGVCSLFGWTGSTLVMWSAFIIFIMCSLRCLSLVKPFYYRSHINSKVVLKAASGTLLFCGFLFAFPLTGLVKPYRIYTENLICAMDFAPGGDTVFHRALIGFMSALALSTISAVLVFNCLIISTLGHHNIIHTTGRAATQSTSTTSNVLVKRRIFQRVTLVVSLVYVLCYLPFAVRILSDTVNNTTHQDYIEHSVTLSLLFLAPLLNPFVYGLFNKGFRDTLICMVTCKKKEAGVISTISRNNPS